MEKRGTIQHIFIPEMAESYKTRMLKDEKSPATIEKYCRDICAFISWAAKERPAAKHGVAVDKEMMLAWRNHLQQSGKNPSTINGKLSSVNSLLRYLGWEDCQVRFLKVQRRLFREHSRQLGKDEYNRLLAAAEAKGDMRLRLLMETICATGIRVSETSYITAEAVEKGWAQIALKGKIRTILLPGKLRRKLKKYAHSRGILSGPIFCTHSGKAMARRQIWAKMKSLCKAAGVAATKVFPHNLRHLFAVSFYRVSKDIVRLADVLGHSSIETTRIYLVSTGEEHVKQLDRLGLVS